ncbi:hypothetical protein ABZS96_38525 [Streptomyces avermitilis]
MDKRVTGGRLNPSCPAHLRETVGEVYFRAHGLEVELKDIVDLQFEL